MRHRLAIVGTDYRVGKTVITIGLATALRQKGIAVGAMKPAETGCPPLLSSDTSVHLDGMSTKVDAESWASLSRLEQLAGPPPVTTAANLASDQLSAKDGQRLAQATELEEKLEWVSPYRFAPELDPAVAARLANRDISLDHLVHCFQTLSQSKDWMIMEAPGALCTPLTEEVLVIDLIAELQLPTLIVAPSQVGSIHHVLVTATALAKKGISLTGVVFNRLHQELRPEEAANPYQVERFLGPVVRGVFPFLQPNQLEDMSYLGQRSAVHLDLAAVTQAALVRI